MTAAQTMRFWLFLLLAGMVVLYLLSDILLPFVAGMAIAYFLDPAADKLEDWGLSRGFAAASIIIFFFSILVVLALLLAPVLQNQLVGFLERAPEYVGRLWATVSPHLERLISRIPGSDIGDLQNAAAGATQDTVLWFGRILGNVGAQVGAFFNILGLVLIMPVVAFFLLRDWDRLVSRIRGWLPRPYEKVINEQMELVDGALAGFIRGQSTVCMILGVLYATAWTLVGLDFGLVLGLVTGLMAFIPYAGAFMGLALAILTGIGQFWPDIGAIGMIVLAFAIVQTLDASVITPRLMGRSVHLHPVWILFALFAGGSLFGFVGVLIAVPAAAVIGVLMRFAIQRYLASPAFLGGDTGAE